MGRIEIMKANTVWRRRKVPRGKRKQICKVELVEQRKEEGKYFGCGGRKKKEKKRGKK